MSDFGEISVLFFPQNSYDVIGVPIPRNAYPSSNGAVCLKGFL
jgi:hypothetical protein